MSADRVFAPLLSELTAERFAEIMESTPPGSHYTLATVGPLCLQITAHEDPTADPELSYAHFALECAIVCYGVVVSRSHDWGLRWYLNGAPDSPEYVECARKFRQSLDSTLADAMSRADTSVGQYLDRFNSARTLLLDGKQAGQHSSVCW